ALLCARKIQKELLNYREGPGSEKREISFTMGISVGQPLTEKEGFFEKAIQMSQRLCLIAGDKEIMTSRLFEELCDSHELVSNKISLRTIKPSEQKFLDSLLDLTESRFSDYTFGVDCLSKEIGVSKTQLYRRITAITGHSPVCFIRNVRLQKALSLLKENKYNISEISLEVGYNNPSYFSKCFQEKYGICPSKIAV